MGYVGLGHLYIGPCMCIPVDVTSPGLVSSGLVSLERVALARCNNINPTVIGAALVTTHQLKEAYPPLIQLILVAAL
jgi:hypothetical protein